MGSVVVGGFVYEALAGRAYDEVLVAKGELDDPVPGKVELLAVIRVPSVLDEDLLGFREGRRDAPVLEAPVGQLRERHPPPPASSGELGPIGGPPDLHDASDLWSLPSVRPSSFIAEPKYVVATDRESRTVGPPGDARDDVLVGVGRVNGESEAAMIERRGGASGGEERAAGRGERREGVSYRAARRRKPAHWANLPTFLFACRKPGDENQPTS